MDQIEAANDQEIFPLDEVPRAETVNLLGQAALGAQARLLAEIADLKALASTNLIPAAASGFEDGSTGGWASWATSSTMANSTAEARTGTRSLAVTCTTNGTTAIQQFFPIPASLIGRMAHLEAWVLTRSVGRPNRISGDWRNQAGGIIQNFVGDWVDEPLNEWSRLTFDGIVPATAVTAYFVIGTFSGAIGEVRYYDDIRLRSITGEISETRRMTVSRAITVPIWATSADVQVEAGGGGGGGGGSAALTGGVTSQVGGAGGGAGGLMRQIVRVTPLSSISVIVAAGGAGGIGGAASTGATGNAGTGGAIGGGSIASGLAQALGGSGGAGGGANSTANVGGGIMGIGQAWARPTTEYELGRNGDGASTGPLGNSVFNAYGSAGGASGGNANATNGGWGGQYVNFMQIPNFPGSTLARGNNGASLTADGTSPVGQGGVDVGAPTQPRAGGGGGGGGAPGGSGGNGGPGAPGRVIITFYGSV